ncbi:MAG TPA: xanthine dehydrogenase family protein molybdopterin-binding subunit, partial [Dehalococcoidia bacterium]|nr:xanthine dehydrogenase family protein molybdopterin-binding subunit [Dehalococcoidia bacterium]
MDELAVVGQGVPKVDAPPKVLGQAQYIDDLSLPNMLVCKVLRSPLPHARILNIDTSRARALPGVKAIVTGDDIPKVKFGVFPHTLDQYALAVGKVRHVGEGVAAVAAVNDEIALEALDLIRVQYEPLPAVFDALKALEPGALAVHEERPDNVSVLRIKLVGDVEKGFQEADHIREDSFRIGAKNHAPMEPHGAIAFWNTDGSLTIWVCSQTPFLFRRSLSRALEMPEHRIRLIKPPVGGGFGGKNELFAHEFAAVWLSRLTGRPVKATLEREEVFLGTRGDYDVRITLRTGIKRDGTITAQDNRAIVDGGAYNSTAVIVVNNLCYFQMLPYIIPNYRFEGRHVYTNKPVGGPLRGHGIPQMRLAAESQLDMLAEDLGLDPVDIRLKNAIYTDFPHPAKFRIGSCGFQEAIEVVAEKIGWRERRGKLPPGRGIGIACSSFPSGVRLLSSISGEAIIKIDLDTGVHLLSGAADVGQGTDTVLCQIAAEELGLRTEDVGIAAFDTDVVPFDLGTFGSGVTMRMGNATLKAAQDAKRQILEAVAPRLEADPQEIEFRGGRVYVRGNPERGIGFRQAVKLCGETGKTMPILGRGLYIPEADPVSIMLRGEDGNLSPAYSFIAQGAEVEVD